MRKRLPKFFDAKLASWSIFWWLKSGHLMGCRWSVCADFAVLAAEKARTWWTVEVIWGKSKSPKSAPRWVFITARSRWNAVETQRFPPLRKLLQRTDLGKSLAILKFACSRKPRLSSHLKRNYFLDQVFSGWILLFIYNSYYLSNNLFSI